MFGARGTRVAQSVVGPFNRSVTGIDLAEMIEPLQNYLLNSSSEQVTFTSAESISSCVERLAEFGDKALQSSNNPCLSVGFKGRSEIHADLTRAYKHVRIAASVEVDAVVILSTESPEKL